MLKERVGTVLILSWLSSMLLHETSLGEEGTVPSWSSVVHGESPRNGEGAGLVASFSSVLVADGTAVHLQGRVCKELNNSDCLGLQGEENSMHMRWWVPLNFSVRALTLG